jgi:putative membrane protein
METETKNENEVVLWDAEFSKSVTKYWLVNTVLVCIVSVVGIPVLPIAYILGLWLTQKYLDSHKCTLTNRTLKVSKGIMTKIEKTVPLDRITDLAIVQGPLMRFFDIEALSVETAGQASAGSLVRLAGIKEGRKFRDAVLAQRDKVVGSFEDGAPRVETSASSNNESVEVLKEIRDVLKRIEKQSS